LSGLDEAVVGEINLDASRTIPEPAGKQEGSILFIARVESVAFSDEKKDQAGKEKEEERIKPLVYENQRYVTTDV